MPLRIDHENTEKEPLMFVVSEEYTTVTGKLLFFIPMTETSVELNFLSTREGVNAIIDCPVYRTDSILRLSTRKIALPF